MDGNHEQTVGWKPRWDNADGNHDQTIGREPWSDNWAGCELWSVNHEGTMIRQSVGTIIIQLDCNQDQAIWHYQTLMMETMIRKSHQNYYQTIGRQSWSDNVDGNHDHSIDDQTMWMGNIIWQCWWDSWSDNVDGNHDQTKMMATKTMRKVIAFMITGFEIHCKACKKSHFNPFMPSEFFYRNSSDWSNSNRKDVWLYFVITCSMLYKKSYS